MKNNIFDVKFNCESGGITSLRLVDDTEHMNFCCEGRDLFQIRGFQLESFEESGNKAVAVSCFQNVSATTVYELKEDSITVCTVFKNNNTYPVYYKTGDVVVETPFHDAYDSSTVCMKERCHAHIWTGLENTYIRCERMGISPCNLGVVFQNGSFSSYRQEEVKPNFRGFFALNISPFVLKSGEEYQIKCVVFKHSGGEDFFEQAKKYDGYMRVQSENGYTFNFGEKIEFSVESRSTIKSVTCEVDGTIADCKIENDKAIISFVPQKTGEYTAVFSLDDRSGMAVFNVIPDADELIEKRLNFIVDKQQCMDEESPLFGAYLVYDNEEQRQYFDYIWRDHNGNRERTGMALSIVKWLQSHDDEKMLKSIELFTRFLLRECVDEDNGTCYGNIGKDGSKLRLYDSPWMMLYFTELYKLTKKQRWIKLVVRILRFYYSNGGTGFDPNGVRFYTMYSEIVNAGLTEDAKELYALFDKHVETIVKNGIIYPPHEVNFEQTIVTPAVTVLIDKYLISSEKFYLLEAEKHLEILQKFDGKQPHYRLNTIPIRYWDDFWFGKNGTYGDVFPHYWSVLSGYGYYLYYKATKNAEFLKRAKRCITNCFCNIKADGSATCSYLFPHWVSGMAQITGKPKSKLFYERKGQRANEFANDQDFALYFWMKMQQDIDSL